MIFLVYEMIENFCLSQKKEYMYNKNIDENAFLLW